MTTSLLPPDAEVRHGSLEELEAELDRRRDAGHLLRRADDPKGRRLGWVDLEDGAYLYVPFAKLTAAEIARAGEQAAGGQDDAPLEALPEDIWADGIESDVMDKMEELAEGEARAASHILPSPEQMAGWLATVEAGVRAAGLDWEMRSYAASPFTFTWGEEAFREHHGAVEVRTDHLGVTATSGTRYGVEWGGSIRQRVDWFDPEFTVEGVRDLVQDAHAHYKKFPRCECEYHRNLRAGRVL